MQISCGVVYSNLNESDPWIYKKGKTMFHMTFPYGETCDSEQYSIRSEIQAESILWGEKKRDVYKRQVQCGTVHLADGSPRLAFERVCAAPFACPPPGVL